MRIILLLLLTACAAHQVNWDTGQGCEAYGIAETDQHGTTTRYSDVNDIPVLYLSAKGVADNCTSQKRYKHVRQGCYRPADDMIIILDTAQPHTLIHEQCHAKLGYRHSW